MFLGACEALGIAPEETLMVGDNELTDGGASDAGLHVLVLPETPPRQPRGLGRAIG
jgi:FMN phosphatase YigB (HAD superfamily)